MTKVDLGSWINEKQAIIRGRTEFPSIELNAIASHFLKRTTTWIVSHPELVLTDDQRQLMDDAVVRLLSGEPLAYITGVRSFFGLDFFVDPNVLIPRPETELLIEHAIYWLEVHPRRRNVLDIGTGSGVIAVTLAKHLPHLKVTAVDVSQPALEIASRNALFHNVANRIDFIQSDLFENVQKRFDLILANLPYIPTADLESLAVIKYEPRLALDGGTDGLKWLTELIKTIPKNISKDGCAILEIQYNQHNAIRELATRRFPQAQISIQEDLASLPRIVTIQL